jgi:hypothetical protein
VCEKMYIISVSSNGLSCVPRVGILFHNIYNSAYVSFFFARKLVMKKGNISGVHTFVYLLPIILDFIIPRFH